MLPASRPETELLPIRGLHDFWRAAFERGAPALGAANRVMLDALGLGLEQTLAYLPTRPDWPSFAGWIAETAGPPEQEKIARYHAWLDGAPIPAATQARLDAIDRAPDVLDARDLAKWEADGYVILREAIEHDQAAAAAALLWNLIGATPDDPASWYAPRANGIMIQHFQDPTLDAARSSPRVHKAFAQLWGTADLWAVTDRLSFNPPERADQPFPGPWLHWDADLTQPIVFGTQGILYLTDTGADQGALQLVPGFHHRMADWLDIEGSGNPPRADLMADAITVPAGAGDLVIWRRDLPHGASPNRAARPRLAQYVNMYSPGPAVVSELFTLLA